MNRPNPLSIVTAVACVCLQAVQAQQPLRLIVDANNIWMREGESAILRYRYGDVPFKPYIKELYTPGGINVLLDAPTDHLHHHGLMFACAVNDVDFWVEAVDQAEGHFVPQPGRQEHELFERIGVPKLQGRDVGRFTEHVAWRLGTRDAPGVAEFRVITGGRFGKPEATVIAWGTKLWHDKPVALAGSHYHGLGMRFVRSMDATGEFRNSADDPGTVFRGEERLLRARWCAYTAQAEGKTITVAMFDHPNNPRHPATWFTMAKPFAYMSATLRLHEEPLKLSEAKGFVLRYGVALWDGRADKEQIDAIYEEWMRMAAMQLNILSDR